MAFSGDNDVVDSVLYDVSGSTLAVTASAIVTSTQPMLMIAGLSGSTVKSLTLDQNGNLVITGTVSAVGPTKVYDTGVHAVSGSVSVYTQGAQLISGSVSVSSANVFTSGPQAVSGSISTYTQGAQLVSGTVSVSSANVYTSGPQAITGSVSTFTQGPQLVSGSISIYTQGAQLISGTVTSNVTGTVGLDRGLSLSLPLFVTGTVGIGGPQVVTGSISLSQTAVITGSVGVTNFPQIQTVTGTVGIGGPLPVVSGPVPLNVTGSVQTIPSGVQTVTGSITIFMASGAYGGKIEGLLPDGGLDTANPLMIGGSDGTNVRNLSVDSLGRLITAPAGSSTSVTSSLAVGYVGTAATTIASVRATTYTEQTTNAQRSIVSANAADASAGTGARTVQIIYYDQSMNGPFSETVTLNGITAVNTVATNICYIEQMYVLTVGTGGTNAGIISLKAATAGGGATIASIAASDGRTFFAHHYVPTGKTCYITGLSVNHNGTTVGSGGLFTVKGKAVLTANSFEQQISDFHRLYGQDSATTRNWGTPVKFVGPGRVTVYVTPETSTATTYRAAMDLYDQ